MTNQVTPIILNINIPPDLNEAAAAALGTSIATFMAQFQGLGTAAGNHAAATARKPRAVADAPAGETDADYRARFRALVKATGTAYQLDGKDFPARGKLSQAWKDLIIEWEAETAKEPDDSPREDAEVIEDDEPTVEAVEAPAPEPVPNKGRKFRR